MADPTLPSEKPAGPILSAAEAKKRLAIYMAVKFAGLAAMFGGVFVARGGINAGALILLAIGAVALFIRPRMLGLTTRPEQ
jgi:hypothetical protein